MSMNHHRAPRMVRWTIEKNLAFSFYLVLIFFWGGGGVMANYIAESAPIRAGIRPATQIFCIV